MDETGMEMAAENSGYNWGADTPPVDNSGGVFSGYSNDVFGTILNKALDLGSRTLAARLSRPSSSNSVTQTQSAPTPSKAATAFNPFPGIFSAFPQSDGKGTATGAGMSLASPGGIILLIVGLIIAALVLRR